MRHPYMATLDWILNPVGYKCTYISNPSSFYHPPSRFTTIMDLSNLSTEDITATTAAVKAA
jgi:hypothetical protein